MGIPKILKPKFSVLLERFGRDNDGGYLATNDSVKKAGSLLSFGIFDDCSFENDFIKVNDVEVHCFDKTLTKNYWKKRLYNDLGAAIFNLNLSHIKYSIQQYRKLKKFFSRKKNFLNIETIKKGSIKTILKNKKLLEPIFFKIDIEGSEYRILPEIIEMQSKLCALVIEFHDVDLHLDRISNFISKFNLELIHVHPNNYGTIDENSIPTVLELTFEKNPLKINNNISLPHFFDQPNNPRDKDIDLIFQN